MTQMSESVPVGRRDVVVVLDDDTTALALAALPSRLGEVLSAGDARLVVDVSGLGRLSSGVVAALLWSKRRCLARGVPMSVRGARGPQLAELRRTGLGAALDVPQRGRR